MKYQINKKKLTLFGEYLGVGPPPTMANRLHLNSISTIPIPPLLNSRRNFVWTKTEER